MFEKFTDRSRRAVVLAGNFAREEQSTHLTTGHLLHGLLAEGESLVVGILAEFGVSLETMAAAVKPHLAASWRNPEPLSKQAWTDAAKQALEASGAASKTLEVQYIAPEHLLLGLISVMSAGRQRQDHVVDIVFSDLKLDAKVVREATLARIAEVATIVTTEVQQTRAHMSHSLWNESMGFFQQVDAKVRKLLADAPKMEAYDDRSHCAKTARDVARLLNHLAETYELERGRSGA